jgi:hypothetical protein
MMSRQATGFRLQKEPVIVTAEPQAGIGLSFSAGQQISVRGQTQRKGKLRRSHFDRAIAVRYADQGV